MDHSPKNKSKKLIKTGLALVTIIVAWWGWKYMSYQSHLNDAVDVSATEEVSFMVKKGDSINKIADDLWEKSLITDKETFKQYVKTNNFDRKIIAGRFVLKQSFTIPEITEIITNPSKSEFVLTVPEGATIQDIDKKLANLELITPGDFIRATHEVAQNPKIYEKYPFLIKEKIQPLPYPLEGYLFPDTYFLNPGDYSNESLISLMLNTFNKRLGNIIDETSPIELNKIIILGSILEKEVANPKDAGMVADVLRKRLKDDWRLDIDATLLYLSRDREIDHNDLKENSPYNTRKFKGLPPGPISNPGLKSIKAIMNPEENPYYFYLTRSDTGEMVYAKTNEEHNQNKARYL